MPKGSKVPKGRLGLPPSLEGGPSGHIHCGGREAEPQKGGAQGHVDAAASKVPVRHTRAQGSHFRGFRNRVHSPRATTVFAKGREREKKNWEEKTG